MSGRSGIEWTEATWNPVTGCSKVSAGCKNCYAETIADRFWGARKFTDVVCHEDRLEIPLHWRKPRRIFVNSMSDLFHEKVPDAFIAQVFNVMACGRHEHNEECWTGDQHIFQILTKRPARMLQFLTTGIHEASEDWPGDSPLALAFESDQPFPNVWLGASVEDQKAADERIPLLLQTPAAVRWISYEPALGPIDIPGALKKLPTIDGVPQLPGPDWVVCGGESGPNARPMNPGWARSLRDQCQEAGVPFFMKQMGGYPNKRGKPEEIPEDLRIRQYPQQEKQ